MNRFFDLRRLVSGVFVLSALLVPLYLLLAREGEDDGLATARLLDTPSSATKTKAGLEAGELAPDFAISTPDGERVRLSELRGRPVLMNFWASWCGSCLTEMPEIQALQEEMGLEAFAVLAINAGEGVAEARRFIDFLDAPFVYGLDTSLVVADAYGVYGLPLSVFIDAEGMVQALYRGHADRARLRTLLTAAIEARPAGDLPVVLRTITTIPRERVLVARHTARDRLVISSRALRCDASYCGQPAVDAIAQTAGVRSAKLTTKAGAEPALTLSFEPSIVTADEVIARVRAALESITDPVYDSPIVVRVEGSR